jgi:hypothetical protein
VLLGSEHARLRLKRVYCYDEDYYGRSVTVVTYTVTDGGVLDTDGVANGEIVDPAGLALGVLTVSNTGLGGLGF